VIDEGEELDVAQSSLSPSSIVDDSSNKSAHVAFSSHPDVRTNVVFLSHPDSKFPLGDEVTASINFSNPGKKTFSLTYAGANLLSPIDDSHYIQNFTIQPLDQIVFPGQDVTVNYTFIPSDTLDPADYKLNAWIVYNSSEGRVYANTYYNNTFELVAPKFDYLSPKNILTYLILLGLTGGIVYGLSNSSILGKSKRKKRTKPNYERAKMIQETWEPQIYVPKKRNQTGSKKSAGSKKRK